MRASFKRIRVSMPGGYVCHDVMCGLLVHDTVRELDGGVMKNGSCQVYDERANDLVAMVYM
jgi:hypothetical protein